MSYRACCRPYDPMLGDCTPSPIESRIQPLGEFGDIIIFCLVTAADFFVIAFYRKRANFDPNALAFICLLWLAFFGSFVASLMNLIAKDELSTAAKLTNYTIYVVTRTSFWGLLYIYMFKLHEIYTVQRYGQRG